MPTIYNEAVTCESSEKWKHARSNEMRVLGENDTFELTTLPPDRDAMGVDGRTQRN